MGSHGKEHLPHAFRAVEVPAGNSTLEFRYEPASFRTGVALAVAAVTVQSCWLIAMGMWRQYKEQPGN